MTRYFFDFFSHGNKSPDTEGTEFDSEGAAVDEAVMALVEMARELLPGGPPTEMAFNVREEGGRQITRVSIVFAVQPA
jgi:hypothetical protein